MTDHPTNAEVKELAQLIDTVNRAQLDFLIKRVNRRASSLREELALNTLSEAAPGRIARINSGIKPKYLTGSVVKIIAVLGGDKNLIECEWIAAKDIRGRRRFGEHPRIPATCLTIVPADGLV